MNRILINLFIGFVLVLSACSGDKGDLGPEGQQGPKGDPGVAGEDGQDGKDGNTTSFYFQNGLNGYEGTVDASIYNTSDIFTVTPTPTPDGERIYVVRQENLSNPAEIDSVTTVIRFDDIAEVVKNENGDNFCSGEFVVNYAVLYISGLYSTLSTDQAFLQTGIYGSDAPLFNEGQVNWTNANNTEPWDENGGGATWTFNDSYVEDVLGPNPGYFTTLSLNDDVVLTNQMPIFIPRQAIESWLCEDEGNKGFRLAISIGEAQFIIYSSDNEEQSVRPMLYFNMSKAEDSGRMAQLSDQEIFKEWEAKSYEEKMEPYYKIYPEYRP